MASAAFSPRARRDLLEAVRWIAADSRSAAQALRRSVIEAADRIGAYPDVGRGRSELADPPVRFLAMTGFPYVIVYDSGCEPPLILRVLHGARDLPEVLRDL